MAPYDHDEEKVALLGGSSTSYASVETLNSEITVKPLRYSEIPQAVSNTYTATRAESLSRYLDDGNHTPFGVWHKKLLIALNYTERIHRGRVLTVDHGDSTISFIEPGEPRTGPLLRWIISLLKSGKKSAEMRKREAEIATKLETMIKSALGDRRASMMVLSGLATAPAKQGRGYATALVKTLNDKADALGCAVWLITDDAKWFYEDLGYVLVAEDWAGVDNPKWKGGPVPLRIMVRECKSVDVQMGCGEAYARSSGERMKGSAPLNW
ncbi:hypothetical protein L226DRAFT_613462 [Lentinus tigrinus ALCF2SS1-7]|uniref:N-acetyltransferase domain-containing protein n=1 Tax=Lentinus tigrinus ALCF2SS1-6 TaxID=1328759 RepID=A0A5C2SEQ7_9APHY|nr:hypothetical protein L227DRAFT_652278 [Lentinus tigrinus ALCF2SS1-6]RPD74650.1 hypothetical protein L226DRAFT_613462 [Lentinus tigrinus ALCF2SS1-7]